MAPKSAVQGFSLAEGIRSRVRLRDGVAMPVLGLGTWKLSAGRSTREAVGHALDAGYRLFDTAKLYANEADVGAALSASGLPREEYFVTTKVWNDDQGYETTLRAFERSRRALGLDQVDLYLIHWPVPGKRLDTWRALEKLHRDGLCRSIGVSNFTVDHLKELFGSCSVRPTVNQVEFNPFLFQHELLEFCRKSEVQLEAYAPLTRGQQLAHPLLVKAATAHGATPAQVMLRWGLQHGVVEIPKSSRADRILENAGALGFELSAEEMGDLDQLGLGLRTTWDPTGLA
ncbi:MAG: aldo/keto reductase [Thermoplasmata archaeon]|nr:aldo/keto reductase [Thermoplasmata archaeon]